MPSFNPFGVGRTIATLFEIRLENDLVVLRGTENEASSQMLRGVVVLCLPSTLKVEDVHLRMTGQSKIGWHDLKIHSNTIGPSARYERTREIFNYKWPPFVGGEGMGSSSKSFTLAATNYEWPFEIVIPGSMAESVEGLDDVHVMYKLKATVARGRLASDLHAYKPVRIIRSLDPAALELAHAMTVENVWPNKVEYSLAIPQKAIIFGTSIQIQMRFIPLLKGLKIGTVKCTLLETHDWTITLPQSGDHHCKKSRDIATWSFEINQDDHYQDMMDESGQDGWVLKEQLPLPKSLKDCLQDVETPGIKVRHKVKFVVALENPDGHISELRASLPVTIFISPNMPIDESGNLLDQTPNGYLSINIDSHAPPLYGEHILDQLYANIDPSGYRTPHTQSGMTTPLYSNSRSGSPENLSSTDGTAGTAVTPDALSSRLQNLNSTSRNGSFFRRNNGLGSGGNTSQELHHGHGSSSSMQNLLSPSSWSFDRNQGRNSASRSNPLSRRTSEEDNSGGLSRVTSGRQTPEHIDYSDMNLNRVPSYTTAVRTPVRSMSYSNAEALPDYNTAVSAPPSPHMGDSTLAGAAGTPGPEMNGYFSSSWGRTRNLGEGIGSTSLHRRYSATQDADAGRGFI